MGNTCFAKPPSAYELNPSIMPWKPTFDALMFDDIYLLQMLKIFEQIDEDGSKSIEIKELLNYLDVDRNRFTKRVFSIFDDDGSGSIDFREFVLSLWNYCTLSKATLVIFAFDMYDRDNSGNIDKKEVIELLKDVYGKQFESSVQAVKTYQQLMSLNMGEFTVDELEKFSVTHPALLYPVFSLQQNIQKKVLGVRFWKKYAEKRVLLSNGGYCSIGKLMELHLNKKTLDAVMSDDPFMVRPADEEVLGMLHVTGVMSKKQESVRNMDSKWSKLRSEVKVNSPKMKDVVGQLQTQQKPKVNNETTATIATATSAVSSKGNASPSKLKDVVNQMNHKSSNTKLEDIVSQATASKGSKLSPQKVSVKRQTGAGGVMEDTKTGAELWSSLKAIQKAESVNKSSSTKQGSSTSPVDSKAIELRRAVSQLQAAKQKQGRLVAKTLEAPEANHGASSQAWKPAAPRSPTTSSLI